ncbi:MAG: hypothetical protein WCG26_06700 [Chloroflexales bacterium]
MRHTTRQINGVIRWANLHLLFWRSPVPFVTQWRSDARFVAVAIMGCIPDRRIAATRTQEACSAHALAQTLPSRR